MKKTENTTQQDSIPKGFWQNRIVIWGITILLAVFFGIVLDGQTEVIEYLTLPALLVLKIVVALAVPMFFLVIINKLITIEIPGKRWRNLLLPLFINTTFAILIGFVVGNLFRPGIWGSFAPLDVVENAVNPTPNPSNIDSFWNVILGIIKNLVPESLIQPLVENNVIQIIVVAFSIGIVLRAIKIEIKEQEKRDYLRLENIIEVLLQAVKHIFIRVSQLLPLAIKYEQNKIYSQSLENIIEVLLQAVKNILSLVIQLLPLTIIFKPNEQNKIDFQPLENVIEVLLEAMKVIFSLVIQLLPFAVFGILVKNIAAEGFAPLLSLFGFVLTMLVALCLQACYYLIVIKFGSWVNPFDFLRQSFEALKAAFSRASSIKTIPDAQRVLVEKIGLKKKSAELGTSVGGNFSKDGTIILIVTSVLYISQMLGQNLNFGQLFFLILTSIFISIGAAGIPNAGLLSLTLVFTAIDIPIDYIAVILVLDWFLDRCYTVINVMGYMTTSLLLDRKNPHSLNKASLQ